MKLSDIVSAMHLPIFAEVPLLIFLGIFVGVALHVLVKREELNELGALPLRGDTSDRRKP